ncbi:MAG: shikimate kinase [Pseudomonadota bacterium]
MNEHREQSEILAHLDRPIVLVGLMGVGKTTVGRRLAARLGLRFCDADHEIEKAAGCCISDIFECYGETAFRDGERRVIARLLDEKPQVLATGGGAFINNTTREAILSKAFSVWLNADIDVLVERTSRRDTRPLLHSGDPHKILSELAAKRNPIYAEADISVRTGHEPHECVVNDIIHALSLHVKLSETSTLND